MDRTHCNYLSILGYLRREEKRLQKREFRTIISRARVILAVPT